MENSDLVSDEYCTAVKKEACFKTDETEPTCNRTVQFRFDVGVMLEAEQLKEKSENEIKQLISRSVSEVVDRQVFGSLAAAIEEYGVPNMVYQDGEEDEIYVEAKSGFVSSGNSQSFSDTTHRVEGQLIIDTHQKTEAATAINQSRTALKDTVVDGIAKAVYRSLCEDDQESP